MIERMKEAEQLLLASRNECNSYVQSLTTSEAELRGLREQLAALGPEPIRRDLVEQWEINADSGTVGERMLRHILAGRAPSDLKDGGN